MAAIESLSQEDIKTALHFFEIQKPTMMGLDQKYFLRYMHQVLDLVNAFSLQTKDINAYSHYIQGKKKVLHEIQPTVESVFSLAILAICSFGNTKLN